MEKYRFSLLRYTCIIQNISWKKSLKTAVILFFLNLSLAHSYSSSFFVPIQLVEDKRPDWILDTEIKGVKFYHSITDCSGKKAVFLKFQNMNNFQVHISWKEVFVTKQVRTKTEGFIKKEMLVPAGEIFPLNCSETTNRKLLILPADVSPAYNAEVESFEYKDVTVLPVL